MRARRARARGAYAVVRRVFEQGAWADRALHGEARRLRLDARDRALATQLALRHRPARGDARPRDRAADRPPVEQARRRPCWPRCGSGVFQLAFLDRVPAHAAVGESVELAKRDAPARRAASSTPCCAARRARARALVAALPEATPAAGGAARTRTREWIAELWLDALGAETARALMAADNEPAEAALRANTLRDDAPRRSRARAARAHAGVDGCPRRSCSTAPFDTFGSPEWERGPADAAVARRDGRRARARARGPASACSTCAPRPAARPPTWPR